MTNTFQSILNFMQSEDRNGTWLDATIEEADYILETINEWLEDGLKHTPKVQDYIEYLTVLPLINEALKEYKKALADNPQNEDSILFIIDSIASDKCLSDEEFDLMCKELDSLL